MEIIKYKVKLVGGIALFLMLFLQGCGSKHLIFQDAESNVKTKELKNRDERLGLSYLVKELVGKSDQKMVTNQFAKTDLVDYWSTSDNAIAANMVGDIISGQMGSAVGDAMGSAVFLVGMFGPDGSQKWVDKVFLPSEVRGEILDSAETAGNYVHKLIASRIEQIAESEGWKQRCIKNCGENNAIYELTLNSLPELYLYKPEKLFVFVYSKGGVKAAAPDMLRDAALGFPVAWEDSVNSSFIVRVFSEMKIDEMGIAALEKIDNEKSYLYGADWIKGGKIGGLSKIGQQTVRLLFDSPYMVRGYGYGGVNRVFYDGKVYQWRRSKAPDGFVYKEIIN